MIAFLGTLHIIQVQTKFHEQNGSDGLDMIVGDGGEVIVWRLHSGGVWTRDQLDGAQIVLDKERGK